jgi:hypothetical protein
MDPNLLIRKEGSRWSHSVSETHGYGKGRHVHSGWLPDTKPEKGSVALHIAGRRKGRLSLEINFG